MTGAEIGAENSPGRTGPATAGDLLMMETEIWAEAGLAGQSSLHSGRQPNCSVSHIIHHTRHTRAATAGTAAQSAVLRASLHQHIVSCAASKLTPAHSQV